MGGGNKRREAGPTLDYARDRRAVRWQTHIGAGRAESADYDGSSTLFRRSWFGRFLAYKRPGWK